ARGGGTAVLTLGAGGALADGPGGVLHVPAFSITAVDTVGAGDAFNGALAVALGESRPVGDAVRVAGGSSTRGHFRSGRSTLGGPGARLTAVWRWRSVNPVRSAGRCASRTPPP